MLQYVMTKLETHNINSDGQIMPNSLQNTDDGLDSGTESDDETGGPDEDMDLSDEDLQLPGPRPSSTPLYSLGSLQLEVTPTTNSTMSKTDSTPTFLVTTPTSDADGGSHSSEEELEEINKTTPPLLPNSSSSSSLLSATPPGSEATPPVEFSTTPPNHVHKPRRSTSPPPCIKDTRPCSEEPHLELRPLDERKERRAISSKRRYRQSRIHHIQRPCLDFEKMQLLKTRAVTSWRHGGELSLFCW